jgi:hypothetical protein
MLGLVLLVPGLAQAEPDEGAKLVARELMAKGRAQREAKDFSGALESFSKAHAIMHVPTTLVEAARARADAGLLLEALALLHELSVLPQAPDEPAPFSRARVDGAALGAGLEQRVPSLRIDLSGSPERSATQVSVDGVIRPDCVSSCRLNPGTHVISARTAKAVAVEQLQVAERESPLLELVFSPIAMPSGPNAVAATPAATADDTPRRAHVPTATWIASGVAMAGMATGAWLGVSAVNERDELRRECAPDCAAADVDDVRRRAVWANVSFGIGLAAAALAVTTYLMGQGSSRETAPRSHTAKLTRLQLAATPTLTAPGGLVQVGATF